MPLSTLREPFTDAFIGLASLENGVYSLWDGEVIIYYGKAGGYNSIRARLQAHKRGDEGPCTMTATAFQQEITFLPAVRELQLLREYLARFNQLPRCNDVLPRV